MTINDLIDELKSYPADAVVTSATVRVKVGKMFSTLKLVTPKAKP